MRGKAGHVRTVPVPDWVWHLLGDWMKAAGITSGNKSWNQFFTVPTITGMLSVLGGQTFRHHVKRVDQSRWRLPASLFDPAQFSAHYREDMLHGD